VWDLDSYFFGVGFNWPQVKNVYILPIFPKRYDYAMIDFVSDDGTIATCPAMILGFVQYITSHWVFLHPNLQVNKSYH
jgi:hypothetical protein